MFFFLYLKSKKYILKGLIRLKYSAGGGKSQLGLSKAAPNISLNNL